jgi:hypothetical protein
MLLAPFQSATDSVIAVQSASADPLNADLERMRRLLAHEVAHVAVALQTKSEKRLGDGNRSMRVRPWVNEGFACVVAAIAVNRVELLERQVARAVETSIDDLDAALDDLSDERRGNAFAIATARVWSAVQARGLGHVFRSLDQL